MSVRNTLDLLWHRRIRLYLLSITKKSWLLEIVRLIQSKEFLNYCVLLILYLKVDHGVYKILHKYCV